MTCIEDGCAKPTTARGWCRMHYMRWHRSGGVVKTTVEQRFWSKVDKTGDCWLWTGALNSRRGGYGRFRRGYAHRFAYELLVGPIADGYEIDHRTTCPKNCVNPAHLRVVTRKQNQENRADPARGAHWNARARKWESRVVHNGKVHYLGLFPSRDEALEVARRKRIELYTHNDAERIL